MNNSTNATSNVFSATGKEESKTAEKSELSLDDQIPDRSVDVILLSGDNYKGPSAFGEESDVKHEELYRIKMTYKQLMHSELLKGTLDADQEATELPFHERPHCTLSAFKHVMEWLAHHDGGPLVAPDKPLQESTREMSTATTDKWDAAFMDRIYDEYNVIGLMELMEAANMFITRMLLELAACRIGVIVKVTPHEQLREVVMRIRTNLDSTKTPYWSPLRDFMADYHSGLIARKENGKMVVIGEWDDPSLSRKPLSEKGIRCAQGLGLTYERDVPIPVYNTVVEEAKVEEKVAVAAS